MDDIPELEMFLYVKAFTHNVDYMKAVKVISRGTDHYGKPIDTYKINPIVNTWVYDVIFPVYAIHKYSENLHFIELI